MKRVLRLVLILLCAIPCLAQSLQTTVTGTVSGATSGYIDFKISPTTSGVLYYVRNTQVLAPQTVRCGLNSSGVLKNLALTSDCLVWGNDVISPANSLYTAVIAPNGTVTNTVNRLLISGTTYSLSNPVFGTATSFTPQFTTVFANPVAANILPAASGQFTLGSAALPFASVYVNQIYSSSYNPSTITTATLNVTGTARMTSRLFVGSAGAGSFRPDTQIEIASLTGGGYSALNDRNPGIIQDEVYTSYGSRNSSGSINQIGSYFNEFGSVTPGAEWSIMGIHGNDYASGTVTDQHIMFYGNRGITVNPSNSTPQSDVPGTRGMVWFKTGFLGVNIAPKTNASLLLQQTLSLDALRIIGRSSDNYSTLRFKNNADTVQYGVITGYPSGLEVTGNTLFDDSVIVTSNLTITGRILGTLGIGGAASTGATTATYQTNSIDALRVVGRPSDNAGVVRFRNNADSTEYGNITSLSTGGGILFITPIDTLELDTKVKFGEALVALGGGAAPVLGTIGGAGPATAAQNTWKRFVDSTGASFWVPVWK